MFLGIWNDICVAPDGITHNGALLGDHIGISRRCKADLSVGSIKDAVVTLPGEKERHVC